MAATCSVQYANGTVFFEPPESGLPAGLLASPALVQVTRGTVYLPVVNVGTTGLLYANTILGTLDKVCVVSLSSGISEVRFVAATVGSIAPEVIPLLQEQIAALDLSFISSRTGSGKGPALQVPVCVFYS